MKIDWVESQWKGLCERVGRSARHYKMPECEEQAEEFCKLEPPRDYTQLLDRVRRAAELAVSWQERRNSSGPADLQEADMQDVVTEAGEESFPASDPPAWTTAAI